MGYTHKEWKYANLWMGTVLLTIKVCMCVCGGGGVFPNISRKSAAQYNKKEWHVDL